MALSLVLLGILAVIVLLVYILYIPLPSDLDNRRNIQIIEIFVRLGHEYPGRVIELFFGAEARIKYSRWLFGLAKSVKCPTSIKIISDVYNGVPVRVYIPEEAENNGAILFIHGGGFCLLNTIAFDGIVFALMKQTKMVVVSVEYRLAPEHKFPAAIDDCENVAVHLMEVKCKELNVDPNKVIVMGDSAGGNLSAVLPQRLKRRKDFNFQFKLQVLIYPMTQVVDYHLPSYQLYYKKYNYSALLDPNSSARFTLHYAGVPATQSNIWKMTRNEHVTKAVREKAPFANYLSHEKLPLSLREKSVYDGPKTPDGDKTLCAQMEKFLFNPDFSPLMATDLKGLPSAFIVTCGYDILRDDGILYAKRLEEEGVLVNWKDYPSGIHGTFSFHSKLRSQMLEDMTRFVQENL